MLIAMVAFHKYPEDVRLNYVKKAYDAFSKFKINLPTPQMAGIRGPLKQYASCCLIDVGDSKESIFSSVMASGYATAQRYGIGLNFGRIRGLGTEIKGGAVIHTGAIPFLKVFESTVKSLQQNGLRGGGGTVNTPFWHWDIEDIIVLKNNGGTEDSRVRHLDYVIQFSKLFYERFMKNEGITLFSPHEVPELVDSWGLPEFDELYKAAENNAKIRYKRKISAKQLMSLFVKERTETGRIYVMNIDHCNEHGSFLDRVTMTNLCTEITFPTTPINHIDDPNGEIGICILSALNLLEIKDDQDLINTCDIIVRMLDELISYQDWFTPAAKNFIEGRRALGVGVTNLAALLAKNNMKYTDAEAANFVDEWFEKVQYHLLSASSTLAEEKGACEKFHLTKYSKGILPIDTYKKKVDQIVTRKPSQDWESLRQRIVTHGLRNSTVTAQMPVESCQTLDTKIQTPRGIFELGDLIRHAGLQTDDIENINAVGWHELTTPFTVKTLEGDQAVERVYYNGKSKDIYEIQFEDGETYKFTGNHLLLVNRNSHDCWVRVEDLKEDDDIISIS
jgi:ribonucleoside-diphosphate reductase alpha chain